MATAIFFGGRRINVPGAYSKIDASELAGLAPGAVGIVALLGTGEGGKPLSVESTDSDHTRAATVLETYRSGDLRIAGSFAFEPSNDEAIPGGAQRVVAVKVNPALQSSVTLPDANAADALDLVSADYGLFTAQISAEVAAGTVVGKKVTLTFEDTQEIIDDIGGVSAIDVLYTDPGTGWDVITGQVTSTQFLAAATKSETGLVANRAADIPSPGVLDIASSNAGDTTQSVTVYGLSALNVPISEVIALNGTTNVQGVTSFTKVLAISVDLTVAGTVTVSDFPVATTLFTFVAGPAGTLGIHAPVDMPCDSVITVSIDVDTAVDVVVRGLNAAGVAIAERFDMTAGNTTPVVGTGAFADITQIELGDVAGARTVTISGNAAATSHSLQTTIQKVADYLNQRGGFTATIQVSNPTTFLMTDMDFAPATTIDGVTANFYSNLFDMITAINNNSGLVVASRASGALLTAANTVNPVYLVGGTEGTTTITEWQAALDLLKKRRVNIIVPLTEDAAVHNLVVAHLKLRAGQLRSEANGWVGIGTSLGAGETKANIKSQIRTLGTRHVSAVVQEVERFDPDTGAQTFYPPYIYAAMHGGMQAGSPIGEPLTRKRPLATNLRQDASWNPEDDTEEMIDLGACVSRVDDSLGIQVVRSITTHLADDNVAFVEMSSNESMNTAVFELRSELEKMIGKRGLGGTVAALKGKASAKLDVLVDNEIIVSYKSLQIEQINDVYAVSVAMAPVNPVNFIPITVHVVATRAAA